MKSKLRSHAYMIIITVIALTAPFIATTPANADITHEISDIGGVTGLDLEYGVDYNGHHKGEKVDHKWIETPKMESVITINAYINDLGSINTGDLINIPVSTAGSRQYPATCDLNKNLYSTDGELLFTVASVSNDHTINNYHVQECSSIILKKVSTRNYGRFEFTLRSNWLADAVSSKSNEETLTIGGISYSFTHEIQPDWKLVECENSRHEKKDKANYAYSGVTNQTSESHPWFTIVQCGNIYRRANGIDKDKDPGDLIAWARIDPSSPDTKVGYPYYELAWFHAYSDLEPGSEWGHRASATNVYIVLSERTDKPDISTRALAAQNLKPFQYAIEKSDNGSWYVAVNYGPQYGKHASTAPYAWTDDPLNDSNLAKLIKNAGGIFQRAVFIPNIYYNTDDENRTASIYYDMGDSIETYASGSFTAQNQVVKNDSKELDSMVTFNNNAVDVKTSVDSVTGAPSNVITLPAGPSRIGHTFAGWNENQAGTGKTYQPGDKYTLPADSSVIVLYAMWNPIIQHSMPVTGSNQIVIMISMITIAGITIAASQFMSKKKTNHSH